jgi:hypothetical protein
VNRVGKAFTRERERERERGGWISCFLVLSVS